jgi:hypothetical protein
LRHRRRSPNRVPLDELIRDRVDVVPDVVGLQAHATEPPAVRAGAPVRLMWVRSLPSRTAAAMNASIEVLILPVADVDRAVAF